MNGYGSLITEGDQCACGGAPVPADLARTPPRGGDNPRRADQGDLFASFPGD